MYNKFMVCLIHGNQSIRVKSQLKAIAKKVLGPTDELNFVKFDASINPLKDVFDEVSSLPLGYDHKIVVLDNAFFLSKEKFSDKLNEKEDYDKLKNIIRDNSPEVDLVLLLSEKEVNKKSEIYLIIEEFGKVVETIDPTPSEWVDVVYKYVTEKLQRKIDQNALKELALRTGGDYASLYSNGQKLALYSDYITYDDVLTMVTRPLEDNTFQIFNYLLSGQNILAISLLKDLRVSNVEPVVLISQLGTQFRLLREVIYLSKNGYDNNFIAKELAIKPVRVTILRKYVYTVNIDSLDTALEDLYNLDFQIKSGQVDRYYAFELFLINFKCK